MYTPRRRQRIVTRQFFVPFAGIVITARAGAPGMFVSSSTSSHSFVKMLRLFSRTLASASCPTWSRSFARSTVASSPPAWMRAQKKHRTIKPPSTYAAL